MQKRSNPLKIILIVLAVLFFCAVFIIPIMLLSFEPPQFGNVAVIPVEGVILTAQQPGLFSQPVADSETIVKFIEKADKDQTVEAIVLAINSPGGSPVASDEIATALKKSDKPTVAIIREVGASGGYWVASASDHIIANRMSITGSIGVISSYLEFSGLMEEYGVGYEQLTAGEYKDMGTPFRKLSVEERSRFQKKLDLLHDFFIEEVAQNRNMELQQVRNAATGEFYLGVEAKNLGLVDELGNMDTLTAHLKSLGIEKVDYVYYEKQPGFFDVLAGAMNQMSFYIGQGMGSNLVQKEPVVRV